MAKVNSWLYFLYLGMLQAHGEVLSVRGVRVGRFKMSSRTFLALSDWSIGSGQLTSSRFLDVAEEDRGQTKDITL